MTNTEVTDVLTITSLSGHYRQERYNFADAQAAAIAIANATQSPVTIMNTTGNRLIQREAYVRDGICYDGRLEYIG